MSELENLRNQLQGLQRQQDKLRVQIEAAIEVEKVKPEPFKPHAAALGSLAFNDCKVIKVCDAGHVGRRITNPLDAVRILHECLGAESPLVERRAVVERLDRYRNSRALGAGIFANIGIIIHDIEERRI
jgi:hypothetical protein